MFKNMSPKSKRVIEAVVIGLLVLLAIKLLIINQIHRLQLCQHIAIAFDESGDLAPAWYESAGELLEGCGKTNTVLEGMHKSCIASRINDVSINCDTEEAAAYPWLVQPK